MDDEVRGGARRRRLLLATPLVAVVGWALISFTLWSLQPTSMPFGVHSVEWVRAQVPFGDALVDEAEHVYYGATGPTKGGPPLKRLPPVGLPRTPATGRAPAPAPVPWPRPVAPVVTPALAGEGVWAPAIPPVGGSGPVLVTTYRPEPDYPDVVAYVGWFDHTRTAIGYYPGRYEPPRAAQRGPMMVPPSQRSRLLATFNGGFTYVDGHNGSSDNGRVNEPLKRGNATLLGYRDGHLAIVDWTGGPDPGPDVAWSRQSLAPIVQDGRVNPRLDTNPNSPQWGYTLGGRTRVWRTGVGLDARGNLLYVAAPGQTVVTLARILQHLGAVQGMEFDINPEWHTFITYGQGHGRGPAQVGRNPMQSDHRYLVPDDRDFFAVYERAPGPVTVPFG